MRINIDDKLIAVCDEKTRRILRDLADTLHQIDAELPAFGDTDAGKMLAVTSAGTGVEWIAKELPAFETTDGGKVLAINEAGTGLEWITLPTAE